MAINMSPLAQASAQPPVSPTAEATSAAARVSGLPQDQELPSLAASTIERVEQQRERLNQAIERMIASRERRTSLPFDPVLMQMAAGFAKPTKTGSFGESMGYAAEAGISAAEREYARQQAEQKLELELQQKLLESAQKSAGTEMLRGFMPGAGMPPMGGAPAAGMPPTGGAPVGAPPMAAPSIGAAPAGAPPGMGTAGAPPAAPPVQMAQAPTVGGVRRVTAADLIRARQMGDPETIKTLQAIYDKQIEEEKLAVQERGLEFTIPGTRRVIKNVPIAEQREALNVYRRSMQAGDPQSYFQYLVDKGWMEAEFEEPPGGGRKLLPPATPEQEEFGKKRAGELAQADVKARGDLMASARAASGVIRDTDQVIRLASDPETKGAFGQLADKGVVNALGILVREGIATPRGSIGIPAIEEALRTAGKKQPEIDAAKFALQPITNMELNFTRIFLSGGGAITEGERALVRRLPPSLSDSPTVAIAKSEMLKARALFDQERAKIYRDWERRNPRKSFDDFMDDPNFKRLEEQYDQQLYKIQDTYFPSKPAAGGRTSGGMGPLESSIRGSQ